MIPHTELRWQNPAVDCPTWQQILAESLRSPEALIDYLGLPTHTPEAESLNAQLAASNDFSLLVPRPFADRMEPGNWRDPLLLQVLPRGLELLEQPGFVQDPLEERSANPKPGIIHKYHGRALLILSAGCAVNCRYCFRRHFPYQDNKPSRKEWQPVLDYLAADKSLREVILSGGDPLLNSNETLAELIEALGAIDHLTTLRIHTRLPIVIPQRIDQGLIDTLKHSRLNKVMVVHANHPSEIDSEVSLSLSKLSEANCTKLNQSVLLADVNDSTDTLSALSQRLFESGTLPYYLHLLDPVAGAAHYDVSAERGRELIEQMRSQLPGYLIPTLVREVAGDAAKRPI